VYDWFKFDRVLAGHRKGTQSKLDLHKGKSLKRRGKSDELQVQKGKSKPTWGKVVWTI